MFEFGAECRRCGCDLHLNDGCEWPEEGPICWQCLSAERDDLLEALERLFASCKSLADSGDAGFWKVEDLPEGKQAMAAIAKARRSKPDEPG